MDEGLTFHLRKRTIAVLLLIAAAVAAVMPLQGKPGELFIYMKAAERILRGQQIYRPDDSHAQAFTYPPFFVLPMLPLAPLPPWVRASVWWFINLVLAGVILFVLARWVWPMVARGVNKGGRPAWVLAVCVAVLSARFLVSPLEYQSHDLIVFALVVLAGFAMANQRGGWAGICGGLAAACKATPLLLLPLFCWQRRYRAALCFVVALVLATLLPDLLFPAPEGHLWITHWYDKFVSKVHVGASAQAAGAWSPWNLLDQSLSGTIFRLSTPVPRQGDMFNVCLWELQAANQRRLTLGLELLIAGWLAWCTWPRRRTSIAGEPNLVALAEIGMVLCAMLLLSPVSSTQHFCMLLAPITACATHWLYVRRDPLIAVALLVVFLFGTLAARDLLGRYAVWPQALGAKTWCTMALLLACGRILQSGDNTPKRLGLQATGVRS